MEVLLRINNRRIDPGGGRPIVYAPKGAVICHKDIRQIRVKWIEILGDLMSPQKQAQFGAFRYYAAASAAWTRVRRNVWLALAAVIERSNPTPAEWDAAVDQAWADMTSTNIYAAMPLDPRNAVSCLDAWAWSIAERRGFFAVKLNDGAFTRHEADAAFRVDEYVDVISGRTLSGPRARFAYETEFGLTPAVLAQINDPTLEFHPLLNVRVAPTLRRTITGEG